MSDYDAIVVGAGHNGLVCATYLAKAGERVLLLEANDSVGGLAAEREFYPGFRVAIPHSLYGLSEYVIKELDLEKYGFQRALEPLSTVALGLDSAPIIIDDESVIGVAEEDAQAYREYRQQMKIFAAALAPSWAKTMPGIGGNSLKELFTFAQLGLKLRLLGKNDMLEFLRVASLPMRDLVDERFDDERLKAALCWDGIIGSKLAPRSPNQGVLTLLNRMAGPQQGQHSLPEAGIASLISALHAAAESHGVNIRTNSAVERIVIEGDERGQRCGGVRLHTGESISATKVVSSADPRSTFLKLVGAPQLEIEFSNRVRRLRCEGYVAKLHLALSGLPTFTGLDSPDGRLLIAPDMDAIEFAFDDAKYGDVSANPVMEIVVPSIRDPAAAPSGQHVLSAHVMYVPAQRRGGWNEEARADLVHKLLTVLEAYAPGIGKLLLHSELLTPADIEHQYHLTTGHWHHVEPAIDQLLMMRPTYEAAQYRTPLEGLFLCGAGSHPGGDLTGNPGRNAAREILA